MARNPGIEIPETAAAAAAAAAAAPAAGDPFRRAQEDYLPGVEAQIRSLAQDLAGKRKISYLDAFRAFERYFQDYPPRPATRKDWFRENMFLLVCLGMTIIFGILAWGLAGSSNPSGASESKSFLDMAKIFAGAVVGSAAGSGMARRRTRAAA